MTAARPGELELTVLARRVEPRPEPQLAVLQAIPKGERGELAVELLTEVGADVIVPWAADEVRGGLAGRPSREIASALGRGGRAGCQAVQAGLVPRGDGAGGSRRCRAAR